MRSVSCNRRVLGVILLVAATIFTTKNAVDSSLLRFVESGDSVALQGAMQWGANPNIVVTGRGFDRVSRLRARLGQPFGISPCDYTFSRSVLMLAIESNNLNTVRTLLRGGATVKYVDEQNKTPLHIALERKANISIVKELLENGADASFKDEDGLDALTTAALAQYPDAVELLLRCGANPNSSSKLGFTPLSIVAGVDSPATRKIMSALLRYGANPDMMNAKKETALTRAIRKRCWANVQILTQAVQK